MKIIHNRGYKPSESSLQKDFDDNLLIKLYNEVPYDAMGPTYSMLMFDNTMPYKEVLSKLGFEFSAILSKVSMNADGYQSKMSEDKIGMKQAYFLKTLSAALGYVFNCSSFGEEEFASYDKMEIANRLTKVLQNL